MGNFIMEFVEHWIRQGMEDQKEVEEKWRQRMIDNKAKSDKNREFWSLPVRPYGYWRQPKHTRVYMIKQAKSNALGRQDPYDVIKPDLLNHIQRPAFLDRDAQPIKHTKPETKPVETKPEAEEMLA